MNNKLQNTDTFMNNHKSTWWVSWPLIIIIFIGFWPAALFLIWKKTTIDKRAALFSGKIITILGFINLGIVSLGLLVCFSQGFKTDDVITMLFFLFAGVSLFVLGKNIRNNADIYKKYISIIVNGEMIDIDNIAASIPTSYENAKKDLQKMIEKGFFQGAYINEAERQLILPEKSQASSSNQFSNAKQNVNTQVVICKGCGAQNIITAGSFGECEFCGSKLEEA